MGNHENIMLIRKEFFELYDLLFGKSEKKEDVLSMGNLALFVDYSYNRYNWGEKKKQIKQFVQRNDLNEVNMLIGNELCTIATRLDISDNIAYKRNKMLIAYNENKLTHFDVVLDQYEFPEWFKRVGEYLPILTKKELYNKLLISLEMHPSLIQMENNFALAYFVDRLYKESNYLYFMTELDYLIYYETKNEVAWFLCMNIFSSYYPEMEEAKNIGEQDYALKKLNELKKIFSQKELKTFDLFSTKMKDELNISFLSGV